MLRLAHPANDGRGITILLCVRDIDARLSTFTKYSSGITSIILQGLISFEGENITPSLTILVEDFSPSTG